MISYNKMLSTLQTPEGFYDIDDLRSMNATEVDLVSQELGVPNDIDSIIQEIIRRDLLSVPSVCGYPEIRYLSPGALISGVSLVYDNGVDRVLRMYTSESRVDTARIISEIDILMRVRHPSISRGRRVITSLECPEMEFAILVDYVSCKKQRTFVEKLRGLSSLFGELPLMENGYRVVDIIDNYCFDTTGNAVMYDFNYTDRVEAGREWSQWFIKFNILTLSPVTHSLKQIMTQHDVTPFERELADDLIKRAVFKDGKKWKSVMDLHEFVWHPLFTMNGVYYEKSTQEPIDIRLDDWPLKHTDYYAPWRKILAGDVYDFYMKMSYIVGAIDMYYRCLPYLTSVDELHDIALACLYIRSRSSNYVDYSHYGISKNMHNISRVIHILKGNLESKFIYNECMSEVDEIICIRLLGLPYDEYMRLLPERWHQVIKPGGTLSVSSDFPDRALFQDENNPISPSFVEMGDYDMKLVRALQTPGVSPRHDLVFPRMIKDELIEFLDLHHVGFYPEYEKGSIRFYLADIADRVFTYHVANDSLQMTPALRDLMHDVDVRQIGRMYTEQELLDMDDQDIDDLCVALEIEFDRSRVMRLLRMNYLIKYDPSTYVGLYGN